MKNKDNSIRRSALAFVILAAFLWTSLPLGKSSFVLAQTTGNIIELSKLTRQDKVSPGLLAAFDEETGNALSADSRADTTSRASAPSGKTYFVASIEFTTPAMRRAQFTDTKISKITGAAVITVIDRFADVFVNNKEIIDLLAGKPGVVRIEGVQKITAPPPPKTEPSKVPSRSKPDEIVRDGFGKLKGKNVIIAVLDTGIDFRHPDFITYDAKGLPTSRLLYLWDTSLPLQTGRGSTAPVKFPNKASIGTLFSKAQLTAELRRKTPTVPPTDLNGHGTACASIAAGNGNADFRSSTGLKRGEVKGVAPEADIIGVRMGSNGFENSYLMNAIVEWLDKTAGIRPLVVSGSFGGHWDGHDGQTVKERQLNERFPLNKQKRAIVLAAGNEGDAAIHATVAVGSKENAKWIRWNSEANGAVINMYFDTGEAEDIVIEPAEGTILSDAKDWDYNQITKQANIRIVTDNPKGALRIYSKSGKPMKADLYLPWSHPDYGFLVNFDTAQANFNGIVGSPGSMANAITVGSYDWNDNFHLSGKPTVLQSVCRNEDGERMAIEIKKISCYSSPGPTRDGRRKPEIAAPGEWFASSRAKGTDVQKWQYIDSTGNYNAMNGTSAATPYTAGIVALMFEKKPKLTLQQVRDALRKASRDPFTGNPPTDYWGNGKLDMDAVRNIFKAL